MGSACIATKEEQHDAFLVAEKQAGCILSCEKQAGYILGYRKMGKALCPPTKA